MNYLFKTFLNTRPRQTFLFHHFKFILMESSQPIPVVRKGFATKKQKEKQILEERAEESKKPNALDAYKDFME